MDWRTVAPGLRGCSKESLTQRRGLFDFPILSYVLPANRYIYLVEPRGFEPLTSAVQMRPDESAPVRLLPECAANAHILMLGIGSLVR
jgi:hypothetical protein